MRRGLTAAITASIGLAYLLVGLAIPRAALPSANAAPYPPTTCPTLAVSTTVPYPGETITVTGAHFAPRTTITLVIVNTSYVIGHARSDANGTFSASVVIPTAIRGEYFIGSTGGTTASCPVDPDTEIDVVVRSTHTTTSDGLPFTGVDVLGMVGVASLLIAAGVGTVSVSRRRAPRD